MNSDTPRLLPVSATFVRAYHLVWYNRALLLRAASIPLLLLTVALGLYLRLVGGVEAGAAPDLDKIMKSAPNGLVLCMTLAEFGGVWTLCAFSVSWRRHLLGFGQGVSALYFQKPLWRYVLTLFVASLAFFGSFFILMEVIGTVALTLLPAEAPLPGSRAGTLLAAITLLIGAGLSTVLIRYILVFTQAMTDEPEARLGPLRRAMRGNVPRLILIWALTICTTIFVPQIITLPLQLFHAPMDNVVVILILSALSSFTVVLLVALLSAVSALVYDFLVRGGGPAGMN